ncbi:MAG: HNH endonuclease [Methanobacteriota archaeon]
MEKPLLEGMLLVRARYECEYCRRLLTEIGWQIEHIWPESRGGTSEEQNLAVSCQRCNNNKGDHVEWIDPLTGSTFPLFNPRTMEWANHFRATHDEVIGISSVGSATAALLFRSTPQYLPRDISWDRIEGLYENQALYYFLNHLRYKRLRNDFNALYKQLTTPLPPVDATPHEQQIAGFARGLLLLELYFTRSKLADVSKGIVHGEHLLTSSRLTPTQLAEVLNILSIFYQQRATIHFEKGRPQQASLDQQAALKFYAYARRGEGQELPEGDDPDRLATFLRAKTLRWKYSQLEVGRATLDACFQRIGDLDPFYATSHYAYLVDLVLLAPDPPNRLVERLYERVSETLRTEGYGTTTDYAKLITLRRRWWVLHFLTEANPDHAALVADVAFWKRVSMFNEIRELDSYVSRVSIGSKSAKDIHSIIRQGSQDQLTNGSTGSPGNPAPGEP